MSAYYGKNLDPNRTNRSRGGFNAERQIIKLTNNPSTIAENQTLEIRFPNLSKNDVIVPGSVYLSFALSVTNGNPVNNIIRNIIKGIDIVIEGNTILSINDSNILYSYMDSWIPESVLFGKFFKYQFLEGSISILKDFLVQWLLHSLLNTKRLISPEREGRLKFWTG